MTILGKAYFTFLAIANVQNVFPLFFKRPSACSQNQIIKCLLGQRGYMLHGNARNLQQIGEERVEIYACFFQFCSYGDRTEVRMIIHLTYSKITHSHRILW